MNRVYTVLAGYFGSSNIGDELILDISLKKLKEEKEVPVIITSDPWVHRKKYGVKCIHKLDLISILHCFPKSKKIIFPGGGIFQDITSSRSLYYYIGMIFFAKVFGLRVELKHIGIGPFINYINKFFTLSILKRCNYISVRDLRSMDLFRATGKHIVLEKDILYGNSDRYDQITEPGINDKTVIGINLRKWHNINRVIKTIGNVFSEFKSDDDLIFLLIPFSPKDEKYLRKLKPHLNKNTFLIKVNPENIFFIISQCDITIGMRLHFNIVSEILGIGGINISYDRKCENVINEKGLFTFIRLCQLTQKKFREILLKKLKKN